MDSPGNLSKSDIDWLARQIAHWRIPPGIHTDDILSDVLIAFCRKYPQGSEPPGNIRGWLLRAASLAMRHRTSIGRKNWLPLPDDVEQPAARNSIETPPLDILPPLDRCIIHLHYWERKKITEIARQLGMPYGTVKSRRDRALQRLRREWTSGEQCNGR